MLIIRALSAPRRSRENKFLPFGISPDHLSCVSSHHLIAPHRGTIREPLKPPSCHLQLVSEKSFVLLSWLIWTACVSVWGGPYSFLCATPNAQASGVRKRFRENGELTQGKFLGSLKALIGVKEREGICAPAVGACGPEHREE